MSVAAGTLPDSISRASSLMRTPLAVQLPARSSWMGVKLRRTSTVQCRPKTIRAPMAKGRIASRRPDRDLEPAETQPA
ncbi:hypothetical protein [Nocardioides sp. NPDC047086]|uniref:hypothetical protein n=1 Tax=Nocardioides sp. NPDC047086 TaxID=3154810 RepID=UPI0033D67CFA